MTVGVYYMLGLLTAVLTFLLLTAIDPMISAHVWCVVTQSERCF